MIQLVIDDTKKNKTGKGEEKHGHTLRSVDDEVWNLTEVKRDDDWRQAVKIGNNTGPGGSRKCFFFSRADGIQYSLLRP